MTQTEIEQQDYFDIQGNGIERPSDNLIEQFMSGDKDAIIAFGQLYLRVNGMEPLDTTDTSFDSLAEQISGKRGGQEAYVHPEGSHQWGMPPEDALLCLVDTERTAAFIAGIKEKVEMKKKDAPDRQLFGYEAGAGTGIMAAAMAYAGCDKVEAIEIVETTAKQAKKFINFLNLSGKVDVVEGDATKHIPSTMCDVVVGEQLESELGEPIVDIFAHLHKSGALAEDVDIIPYGIMLSYKLAHTDLDAVDPELFQGITHHTLKPIKEHVSVIEHNGQTIGVDLAPILFKYDPRVTQNSPEMPLDVSIEVPSDLKTPISFNSWVVSMGVMVTENIYKPPNSMKFAGTDDVNVVGPWQAEAGDIIEFHPQFGGPVFKSINVTDPYQYFYQSTE